MLIWYENAHRVNILCVLEFIIFDSRRPLLNSVIKKNLFFCWVCSHTLTHTHVRCAICAWCCCFSKPKSFCNFRILTSDFGSYKISIRKIVIRSNWSQHLMIESLFYWFFVAWNCHCYVCISYSKKSFLLSYRKQIDCVYSFVNISSVNFYLTITVNSFTIFHFEIIR